MSDEQQVMPDDEHMPAQAGIFISAKDGSQIDIVGTVFLGIAFLILLLAYMRAQGRNRKLTEKLAKLEKK